VSTEKGGRLMANIGRIHSLESFGTVDGPGIRFVVFMQGCPLRCQFCHNPDTWDVNKGNEYTPDILMEEIIKYKPYMEYSGGGVTFTGGEPLLQADFILEVSKQCRDNDISVAIDTSGFVFNDTVKELLEYTDLVLLDIKNYDPIVYKIVTGVSLSPTLKFLEHLKEIDKATWVRYVVVPQLTDNLDYIKKLSEHLDGYPNVEKIELLGFHKMGEYKWKELGMDYQLADTKEPSKELMEQVKEILGANGRIVTTNT
jgi:pyruvate formate lyase activating enzyme